MKISKLLVHTDLNYQNDFHDSITKYNTNIIIVFWNN